MNSVAASSLRSWLMWLAIRSRLGTSTACQTQASPIRSPSLPRTSSAGERGSAASSDEGPEFVHLDLAQVEVPKQILVDFARVLGRQAQPVDDRVGLDSPGSGHSPNRAALDQLDDGSDDLLGWGSESVEHGALGLDEGALAGVATVAAGFVAVDVQVALTDQAVVRALGVEAELLTGVQRSEVHELPPRRLCSPQLSYLTPHDRKGHDHRFSPARLMGR